MIYPYTTEEIQDNYEFKVVKKALMRELPWIKDVHIDDKNLNKYRLIFLDFSIDPIMLGEEMGWELTPWVERAYREGKEYSGIYLSLLFDNVKYEDTSDIVDEITNIIDGVHDSPALPQDLKLRGGRKLSIGHFYVNKGSAPWF